MRRLADEVRSSVNDAMRTLRADLAAAARDARDEAKAAGRSMRTEFKESQVDGRMQLQQAEALLNEFRAALRSELRVHVSRHTLTDETVATLRTGLDEVKRSVIATLK